MRERIIHIVVIIVCVALAICGTWYFMRNNGEVVTGTKKNVTIKEDNSISEAIDKVYDAVVVVDNYSRGRLTGYGSGFVYKKDSKRGYILTNYHVVEGADEVKVELTSGEEVDAEVLGTDEYTDIAVLGIDPDVVTTVAELGDSSEAKLGDTIFTVGTPVSQDYAGTVTKGIISGENREVTLENDGQEYVMEAIQIDASINPGNSGGPLVNMNGQVIGVNSVKLVESSVEGMGFAIPIEVATAQLDKLENGKEVERPVIGVSLYDVNNIAALYQQGIKLDDSIKNGVVVNSVEADSDADKAGLKAGDVILKIDGTDVRNSAHLKYILYKHNIGDSVKLTISRDGKERELTLQLTKRLGD